VDRWLDQYEDVIYYKHVVMKKALEAVELSRVDLQSVRKLYEAMQTLLQSASS
jgi:hypothetical protein